ncbi:O-methyltransferase [Marixanthomonas ophiurae]|uniref:Class I SAM-dependent methyltransferase n=1 Tax=Marixanthomonas ophiurae TaxID=387659 RepID=A0A3E1QD01_9FLAO|nr:class I SAM-dependent methyltransferase [Marixanthomonas ophiurae]RFN60025.1 class I SAM-dependent methyltransferase [Marixanthomonas ophiurae]
MKHQILSYLSFLLRATNQHGVHSPFVYQLLTQCFYDKKKYNVYKTLKNHRESLLADSEKIEVTDFGAGSRVFKTNNRKVADIAKHAGITSKSQKLLFRLVHYYQPTNILELGTSLGMATTAMALGNSSATIKTVEGCPNTLQKATDYFANHNISTIKTHQQSFESFFDKHPSEIFDLVFIDGNHNKENTLKYFKWLLNHINNDSVLIFDDIYWNKEMTEAWQEILKHPKVTVSVDTFQWGLVFFRKEQRKQHFSIRL